MNRERERERGVRCPSPHLPASASRLSCGPSLLRPDTETAAGNRMLRERPPQPAPVGVLVILAALPSVWVSLHANSGVSSPTRDAGRRQPRAAHGMRASLHLVLVLSPPCTQLGAFPPTVDVYTCGKDQYHSCPPSRPHTHARTRGLGSGARVSPRWLVSRLSRFGLPCSSDPSCLRELVWTGLVSHCTRSWRQRARVQKRMRVRITRCPESR